MMVENGIELDETEFKETEFRVRGEVDSYRSGASS